MESLQNPSLGTSVFNSIVHERLNVLPSALLLDFLKEACFVIWSVVSEMERCGVWRNLQCFWLSCLH